MCIGYNPASVYVRRGSGKTDAVSVAEIIISAVGDQYAQEELDAENAEAERYPLGPKEFWRGRMVVNYSLAAGVTYLGGPEIVGPNMESVALFEPHYAGEPDEPTPGHSFIVRHVNGSG